MKYLVGFAAGMLAGMLVTPAQAQKKSATRGELEIRATDQASGQPTAVRMHLKDSRGRPVFPPKLPHWNDHFVFLGRVVLDLRPGQYTFEIERGPEYRVRSGEFTIQRGATDNKEVSMVRFVDMAKEGWWSGDLHIHRSPADIPLLMLAEDLHIAPVITWWNDKNPWLQQPLPPNPLTQFDGNRYYHLLAGEDERGGGAVLFFNLSKPLSLQGAQREYPCALEYVKQAREQDGVHIDIEKPFWWDMPVWVASGMVDSIGLANNHMQRDGMMDNEAWGKPRDKQRYPSPMGNGRWSQDIYYELLNAGVHLPPSAGSASGVLANPVGYNRVYVYCGSDFTWEKWWEGLRAGRVVVTNGPLLRPLANGKPPGHVFQAYAGESVELSVQLNLGLRDKVDYLELVKNGEVVHEVRLDEYRERRGQLPIVKFEQSGWLLVRAVASHPKTFRFASSGPFYVQIGDRPRISRKSAQFFLDWVNERISALPLTDPAQRAAVLPFHEAARDFWQKRVDSANAE